MARSEVESVGRSSDNSMEEGQTFTCLSVSAEDCFAHACGVKSWWYCRSREARLGQFSRLTLPIKEPPFGMTGARIGTIGESARWECRQRLMFEQKRQRGSTQPRWEATNSKGGRSVSTCVESSRKGPTSPFACLRIQRELCAMTSRNAAIVKTISPK